VQILHLSDLHLREGWYEEQGVILDALSQDLRARLGGKAPPFLIFSGDFVQAGASPDSFAFFAKYFEPLLDYLQIDRSRRIFVPGNHDVSHDVVRSKLSVLFSLAVREDNETHFNERVYTEYEDLIRPKFEHYLDFEARHAAYGCGQSSFCGAGHDLVDGVGVYTLNTALFSFCGENDSDGRSIDDAGLLRVETRNLHRWLQENNQTYRILVMHHPANQLIKWAQSEIERVIKQSFNLVLQGHVHMPDAGYLYTGTSGTLVCTAPPLFTRKSALLGYTIIDIDATNGLVQVSYRQASRSLKFVSGSFFTDTDDGVLRFGVSGQIGGDAGGASAVPPSGDNVLNLLRAEFDAATTCHSSLGSLWVAPDIGTLPETDAEKDTAEVLSPANLLGQSGDLIIKAPPLFGLTSLGHFLALEAWVRQPGRLYLIVAADDIPNHDSGIQQAIQKRLEAFGKSVHSPAGLILDNVVLHDKLHIRKIGNIRKVFPAARLLLLVRIDNQERIGMAAGPELYETFAQRYLWALDRTKIRELVQQYCAKGCLLDEDDLTQKIIDDLRVMNLYRTPLNCITLMRIANAMFDHTPVNRTEMIERFLFLIFTDFAKVPKYGTIPDLKDSQYALGYLCEVLLRRGNYGFSKAEFFAITTEYCNDKVIDLDVDILFGCLVNENILVCRDNMYRFRFYY
jgi:predicted MPP superfamily phosphohydrolase